MASDIAIQLPLVSTTHHSEIDQFPRILTIPQEILLKIFSTLRSDELGIEEDDKESVFLASNNIKNLRLVCRHFKNVSSKFLVNAITMEATSHSLRRLEVLAAQPLIANHIETIQVVLHRYYNPEDLTDKVQSWLRHIYTQLFLVQSDVSRMYHDLPWAVCADSKKPATDLESKQYIIDRARRVIARADSCAGSTIWGTQQGPPDMSAILAHWREFRLHDDRAGPDLERFGSLLERAYRHMQNRAADQLRVLGDQGTDFAERMAAAAASMPNLRKLWVRDYYRNFRNAQFYRLAIEEQVARFSLSSIDPPWTHPSSTHPSSIHPSSIHPSSIHPSSSHSHSDLRAVDHRLYSTFIEPLSWGRIEGLRDDSLPCDAPLLGLLVSLPAALYHAVGARLDEYHLKVGPYRQHFETMNRSTPSDWQGLVDFASGLSTVGITLNHGAERIKSKSVSQAYVQPLVVTMDGLLAIVIKFGVSDIRPLLGIAEIESREKLETLSITGPRASIAFADMAVLVGQMRKLAGRRRRPIRLHITNLLLHGGTREEIETLVGEDVTLKWKHLRGSGVESLARITATITFE